MISPYVILYFNLYLRRKAIQFISFDIDRIEDHLQDGEEYCIISKPNIGFQLDTSERLVRSKLHEQLHELIRSDIEHHILHTYQTENETRDVLKNIYRAARNAIEENVPSRHSSSTSQRFCSFSAARIAAKIKGTSTPLSSFGKGCNPFT